LSLVPPPIQTCPQCRTQLAPTMKACPVCARLVHADELASLASNAREATDRGDLTSAMAAWREALDLLPAASKQYQVISNKITELGMQVPASAIPQSTTAKSKNPFLRALAGFGAIAALLWKMKALALGLTKGSTLFSMLLSLGVYWTAWGWPFALGLVLSIYVHEMGHVFTLRRYGFKSSAPMFIPGIGALIRLQQKVVNPQENADIGLAGPIYGLGAAIFSYGLWLATGHGIFVAIASVGAWLNLFNLIPIGPLDGGRGFHALSHLQKLLTTVTALGLWIFTDVGMLGIIAIVGFGRFLLDPPESQNSSWKATITYLFLLIALTALAMLKSKTGLRA
jgi:Zn-dependent protease